MTKPNGFVFALALCALAPAQSALSQTYTGAISGVVTDPNSARIPHATVHARNEANGEVRQVTTGIDGLYVFSQLLPGSYELSAEVQGFRKAVQTGVVLRVNQTLEVNFSLQLGANAYEPKPIDLESFMSTVKRLLSDRDSLKVA